MKRLIIILLGVIALSSCVAMRERSALECARASDGTDMAIVDCYYDRGLPYPEGV